MLKHITQVHKNIFRDVYHVVKFSRHLVYHVDYRIYKFSQRLYLMRILKRMGMDSNGLKTLCALLSVLSTYYRADIRNGQ